MHAWAFAQAGLSGSGDDQNSCRGCGRKDLAHGGNQIYSTAGNESEKIDVRLSYGIVRLFSEGLYASPNKAVEELVANSFDAGARRVAVLLPSDFNDQGATIAVIDDGEAMDATGLKTHWLIGKRLKRALQSRA